MFTSSDLKTVRHVLSVCYLGDWWVLYQLGRNSNTHFYRYLLRQLESSIAGHRGRSRGRSKSQRSRAGDNRDVTVMGYVDNKPLI